MDLLNNVYSTIESHKVDIANEFQKENIVPDVYEDKRGRDTTARLEASKAMISNRKPYTPSPRDNVVPPPSPSAFSSLVLKEPEEQRTILSESAMVEPITDISDNTMNV
jgi:hypothetical protein